MPTSEPLYGLVPGEWVKGPVEGKSGYHYDYEILSLIGQGSQSRVYRCRLHPNTIPVSGGPRPSYSECSLKVVWRKTNEALQEAEVLQQLDHPAVPKFIETWSEDGRVYVSREFVDGISLETLVERQHKLNAHEALALTCEILDVLDYMHTCSANLVHCDVKPQNLLMTVNGIRLIDFGLAAPIGASIPPMGSLSYSAPEQLCQGRAEVTGDLYSVGAVVYFLLNGKAPSPIEAGTRFEDGTPTGLPDFVKLAQQCLASDPSCRPQSAEELLVALRYLQARHGLSPDFRPAIFADPQLRENTGQSIRPRSAELSLRALALLLAFVACLYLATSAILPR